MKKLLLLLLLPLVFAGCKGKKTKLADDDTVSIADFVDFFPDTKLPFFVADSLLSRKETDSSIIGNRIFLQFIPDSVLSRQFGAGAKPRLYPLGKVKIKKQETYLFLKASTPAKSGAFVIALDKDNNFITSLPLLVQDKNFSGERSGGMDSKYVVTKSSRKKGTDEQYNEEKSVYILNSEAREFSIIMTDIGVDEDEQDIINPIDTLSKKHKFSGDYIKDKRNIVSIRDGKNATRLAFFVHFEKDNGDCSGELKGEAEIRTAKTAVFRATGNPCELEFSFEGNKVTMKELTACGSYRDIRLFF